MDKVTVEDLKNDIESVVHNYIKENLEIVFERFDDTENPYAILMVSLKDESLCYETIYLD